MTEVPAELRALAAELQQLEAEGVLELRRWPDLARFVAAAAVE